ncbi:probable phospholipid hydroperoxide glutathione peroxidase [Copidosoma floridanum]|uniref:probable phospholipid hydroperoxide glutathione peroxidase n=1 Tax=Copidosoma floridanum TaxID=29053 RepID=UPI000C6F853E|nr:probable phospholipid hydroperoxide glutathione peroxidase [Copidosoma floridanum]
MIMVTTAKSVYDFVAKSIKGEDISLEKYKGNVLVIVNVASRCGYTSKNYKELNELYEKYESQGLRILAFPCNQFRGQEPGDADKICQFAAKKNVKFDLFEKINVNGKNAHPLWKYLKKEEPRTFGDLIKWNFTKFLIDKNGKVVERFPSSTNPLKMTKDIEKYLNA